MQLLWQGLRRFQGRQTQHFVNTCWFCYSAPCTRQHENIVRLLARKKHRDVFGICVLSYVCALRHLSVCSRLLSCVCVLCARMCALSSSVYTHMCVCVCVCVRALSLQYVCSHSSCASSHAHANALHMCAHTHIYIYIL